MRSFERIGHIARSFEEAEGWDREQILGMPPDERVTIARILRERVYGTDCLNVREAERQKQRELVAP